MSYILKVIHYYWLISLKTSENGVQKLMNWILQNFFSASELAWKAAFKKTEVKLELLADIDILLMVEKEIRGEICHAIHWYAKDINKYMKDHDKK